MYRYCEILVSPVVGLMLSCAAPVVFLKDEERQLMSDEEAKEAHE